AGDRIQAEEIYARAHQLHTENQNYAEAEKLYIEAARIDPSFPAPYYQLACILALTERPDQAMRTLRVAVEMDTERRRWFTRDSDLESLHEREDYKELVRQYVARPSGEPISIQAIQGKTLYFPAVNADKVPWDQENMMSQAEFKAILYSFAHCRSHETEQFILNADGQVEVLSGAATHGYRKHTGEIKSARWYASESADQADLRIETVYRMKRMYADFAEFDETITLKLTGIRGRELMCGANVCLCLE
ncbi:MAG: hypothetical protein KDK27_15865, partial [Leptospiraceae bacterium]|nr:hypothetical protein [Leptospiraceae bacterium]